MKRIGITGNIGCGKSTISKLIAQKYKLPLINVDEFSKNFINLYDLRVQYMAKAYECEIYPNAVDTVRNNIFTRIPFRLWLEDIIEVHFRDYLDRLDHLYKCVIIEHPTLFELQHEGIFDYIIGVKCSLEIQLDRLRKRGYSDTDIANRLNSLILFSNNESRCDVVFDTTLGTITEEQIDYALQISNTFNWIIS